MQFIKNLSRSDVYKSGFWVLLGLGLSLVIRLGSNLTLTKLLAPEYFGIMALMYTILQFVSMVSDIGLVPSIINTKRYDDDKFMNTAWTLQVIRSTIVGFSVMIVAYPMAKIYEQPDLFFLTIAAGLMMIAVGFSSTAPLIEQKFLRQKTLVLTQLAAQVLGTGIMIALAFIYKSVWVLLSGYILSELLKMLFSYICFQGHHSRFAWDKSSVSEIIKFGRWIFIASIIAYFATRMDILVLGKLMSIELLGVYSIAALFAGMLETISNKLSVKVLHPQYRKLINNNSGYGSIYKARNKFNLVCAGLCLILAWIGDLLIEFLYDDRYLSAGWMLQILAIGTVSRFLTSSLKSLLNAVGDSFSTMLFQLTYTILIISLILVGYHFFKTEGIIIAVAMSPVIAHPIMMALVSRHKFQCLRDDGAIIIVTLILTILGWYLLNSDALQILQDLWNQDTVSTNHFGSENLLPSPK